VVFSNILGIFFMALTLEDVVKELRKCTAELKESNDKWEKANEPKTTLRPSDDGATPEGSIRNIKLCNRRENDEHTQ
jgi:hypothetical protein